MRYIQSPLRSCCGPDVFAIWTAVLSSDDFVVSNSNCCLESELMGVEQQQQNVLL